MLELFIYYYLIKGGYIIEHIQIIKDAFDIYGRQYKSLGDYSATTLINPPRQIALIKRYGYRVKPSIESQAASLIGTAVHEKMEQLLRLANITNPEYMLERSIVHPFEIEGIMRLVAGRFDILHEETNLYDLKTAKVWKLIFDPDMIDWHQQQNIYAYLLKMRGIDVQTLNIVAFYLDWIESNAIRDKNYPQAPIVQYKLKLWSPAEQKEFIEERLRLHITAEFMKDEELPECTPEERWERAPSFAIMKSADAKRATKVINGGTFADALEIARGCSGLSADSYIEVRHADRKRCEKYCLINEYCNVYQRYSELKQNNALNDIFPLASVL